MSKVHLGELNTSDTINRNRKADECLGKEMMNSVWGTIELL